MGLSEHLCLGDPLSIGTEGYFYTTKLLDFVGDWGFTTYRPTYRQMSLFVEEGEKVQFFFYREDGLYGFWASFTGSFIRDGILVYEFIADPHIIKNQRRQSYRLSATIPIEIRLKEGEDHDEEPEYIQVTTINISEYGLLISAPNPFPLDEELVVRLKLRGHSPLLIDAKVVRCETPVEKENPYRIAVQFIDISNKIRKSIAQYILRQQIIIRQKSEEEEKTR